MIARLFKTAKGVICVTLVSGIVIGCTILNIHGKTTVTKLSKCGVDITLIGCCHIGSPEYYKELSKHIDGFVLFEGVGGMPKLPSDMYGSLAHSLGLVSQKESLKYNPEWVNSDIKWEDIPEHVRVDLLDKLSKMPELVEKVKGHPTVSKILVFVADKMIALIFTHEGEFHKEIVLDRNDIVLNDTWKAVASGEKNISILYGEGHIPGIIEGLEKIGFERGEVAKVRIF